MLVKLFLMQNHFVTLMLFDKIVMSFINYWLMVLFIFCFESVSAENSSIGTKKTDSYLCHNTYEEVLFNAKIDYFSNYPSEYKVVQYNVYKYLGSTVAFNISVIFLANSFLWDKNKERLIKKFSSSKNTFYDIGDKWFIGCTEYYQHFNCEYYAYSKDENGIILLSLIRPKLSKSRYSILNIVGDEFRNYLLDIEHKCMVENELN